MDQITLPIDVVRGSDPPMFRWKQTISTPDGRRVVHHEGQLPCAVEVAVSRMVAIVKQLLHDNMMLRGQLKGQAVRLASQDEQLNKKAEVVAPAHPPRKIRG